MPALFSPPPRPSLHACWVTRATRPAYGPFDQHFDPFLTSLDNFDHFWPGSREDLHLAVRVEGGEGVDPRVPRRDPEQRHEGPVEPKNGQTGQTGQIKLVK